MEYSASLTVNLRSNDDPTHMNIIAMPSMVISAFASELYLKCLLLIERGSAPQVHFLDSLFSNLKPKTQARVRELWAELLLTPQEVRLRGAIESFSGVRFPTDLEWA